MATLEEGEGEKEARPVSTKKESPFSWCKRPGGAFFNASIAVFTTSRFVLFYVRRKKDGLIRARFFPKKTLKLLTVPESVLLNLVGTKKLILGLDLTFRRSIRLIGDRPRSSFLRLHKTRAIGKEIKECHIHYHIRGCDG